MSSAPVERGTIRRIQRLVSFDPLDQVGIGDEQAAEDDCVRLLLVDCLRRTSGV